MAEKLLSEGIYVIGFFFPVVPKDQARIRVQISAGHTLEDLDKAISAFIKIGAIEDEKFAELVENSIIFETIINSDKDVKKYLDDKSLIKSKEKFYTTLSNYKERNNIVDSKKIIYCSDVIGQSSALNICLSDNKEVIKSDPLIDAQFLPWIELSLIHI